MLLFLLKINHINLCNHILYQSIYQCWKFERGKNISDPTFKFYVSISKLLSSLMEKLGLPLIIILCR